MDLQQEYESATDGINTIVSNQLSSSLKWANIPGSLIKVSASDAGYAWGYNGSHVVYKCALPCTGNWEPVDLGKYNIASIINLATDATNVYLLILNKSGQRKLLIGNPSGRGDWTMIDMKFDANTIFPTNTYVWAQDEKSNKQKCAKPCTTGNWSEVQDKDQIQITSSNGSTLFGTKSLGQVVKTDENMQNGWVDVNGLTGITMHSVVSGAALYGKDNTSNSYRCEGDCISPQEVTPLDTSGYTPLNLTANTKDIWMTSTKAGDKGNIFMRPDKPDYTSILNNISKLDENRDKVVSTIEDEYNQQTKTAVSSNQISTLINFIKKQFNFDTSSIQADETQANQLSKQVSDVDNKLKTIQSTEPLIKTLLIVVSIVGVLYLIAGPILGSFVHIIAFIVLIGGLGYAIYSSSNQ
jgi:hypothetical protein